MRGCCCWGADWLDSIWEYSSAVLYGSALMSASQSLVTGLLEVVLSWAVVSTATWEAQYFEPPYNPLHHHHHQSSEGLLFYATLHFASYMPSKGWLNLESAGNLVPENQFFEGDSAFKFLGLTRTQRLYGFIGWWVVDSLHVFWMLDGYNASFCRRILVLCTAASLSDSH